MIFKVPSHPNHSMIVSLHADQQSGGAGAPPSSALCLGGLAVLGLPSMEPTGREWGWDGVEMGGSTLGPSPRGLCGCRDE